MATYIPKNFTPGIHTIYNGKPTEAEDPQWIDRYATWLAAGWKPAIPCIITEPLDSGSGTYNSVPLYPPPFTRWLAVGFLVCGRGSIEVSFQQDTYTATTGDIEVGTGTAGSHSFEDAEWIWLDEPYEAVAGDGLQRALDVDVQDSDFAFDREFNWTITDASGTESLRVYSVMMFWLPPSDSEMP